MSSRAISTPVHFVDAIFGMTGFLLMRSLDSIRLNDQIAGRLEASTLAISSNESALS
jgi:hypothetical protein